MPKRNSSFGACCDFSAEIIPLITPSKQRSSSDTSREMLNRLTKHPYICLRCLRRQQQRLKSSRGYISQATAPITQVNEPLLDHSAPDIAKDGHTLRRVFDSPEFFKDFSTRSSWQTQAQRTGLLHNRYLTNSQGFQEFSQDALTKCKRIVSTILAASTIAEYQQVVRHLDRLSDQLCRVIDLVDFIRNVHPDSRIQHAAAFAHSRMYEYMNVLNTTQELHNQLEKACSIPQVVSQWSEEEKATARILLKDFQQSAISGPETSRQRFVQVSNAIAQLGTELNDNMSPDEMSVKVPSSKLKGMDPVAVKRRTRWGITTLPTFGSDARLALSTVEDEEVRRSIYMAMRTASKSSVEIVERLVRARAELAHLSGHESFAHMALTDKMSRTPEAVAGFLQALSAKNKLNVQADLSELVKLKQSGAERNDGHDRIQAWDRDFYSAAWRSKRFRQNHPSTGSLAPYFSLGTVMKGLSRLFSRLYGVRLVPRTPAEGETWNHDVRRLDVIDERDGHIAVIYCDLFERPNKSPNPAHFTLRCSREITPSEINDAVVTGALPTNPSLLELSNALNDGMALNRNTESQTIQQLPTIGFICDFPCPSASSNTPTLLSFRQVTTLFHEMGHCLHSILGRTTLQNVAGTRCATDFAELPSILMEHFAADPAVLSLYARHWKTDEPLDPTFVTLELERTRQLRVASETEAQILLSVLDQSLHASGVPCPDTDAGGWSSTAIYHAVHNDPRLSSVPEPQGTAWHGFFGHLYQYGAVYYSYLFDRAIAAKLWEDVFANGKALDRRQGERYRESVLKWGGGRDPWICVGEVLGEKYRWIGAGGQEAMTEVGRWGAGGLGDAVGL